MADQIPAQSESEIERLRAENERLRAFAFGDAPEWEKANATLKHRVRELEAEIGSMVPCDDAAIERGADAIRERLDWTPAEIAELVLRAAGRDAGEYEQSVDLFELVEGEKHDADCQRRRTLRGWRLICSCGMTDEQVNGVNETADDL